jgi:hypothetical protein
MFEITTEKVFHADDKVPTRGKNNINIWLPVIIS